jgi:small-conductance mechanosensitive channel
VAGTVEGTVTSLDLLDTTLANRADRIMVPNNVVLSAAVVPLREHRRDPVGPRESSRRWTRGR